VRMAREGDTIRPLGLGGTKKVYKAMKDRKVPRDIRTRTPVVNRLGGEGGLGVHGRVGRGVRGRNGDDGGATGGGGENP
jgi:tRNA(Ile)-lysidine synthase